MIRRGPWKLYKYAEDTPPVLFNLEDDPHETHDLAQDPSHAQVREELLARLYEDWDPAYVLQEASRLDSDLEVLRRWGRATQPKHEDTLPVPDVEEIELL